MSYAGQANLLGAERRYRDVETPVGTVRIQSLSELEKSRVDAAAIDYKRTQIKRDAAILSRARLICAVVVDEAGERVFKDEDVDRVAHEMDSKVADAIFRGAQEHVGGEDEDFEELVGNSD